MAEQDIDRHTQERIVADLHEQLRRSRHQEELIKEALTRTLTVLGSGEPG